MFSFNQALIEKSDLEFKRREYDAKRYRENTDIYKQKVVNYRLRLKEDIPKMRAKILKQLESGKKQWLTHKTMLRYNITHDKTTHTYS